LRRARIVRLTMPRPAESRGKGRRNSQPPRSAGSHTRLSSRSRREPRSLSDPSWTYARRDEVRHLLAFQKQTSNGLLQFTVRLGAVFVPAHVFEPRLEVEGFHEPALLGSVFEQSPSASEFGSRTTRQWGT
jgi:hypothetical protein